MAAQSMESWMRMAHYTGPYKDTILLNRKVDVRTFFAKNSLLVIPDAYKRYARYENTKLKIVFDPSMLVTMAEYEYIKPKGYKYYEAYPIMICNETDSITIVGEGFNIPVLLEALDTDKTWKPVEQLLVGCGTDVEPIMLKPGEIMCVLAPVYTGSFKTTLRYRLGKTVSVEFDGYISPNQFVDYIY